MRLPRLGWRFVQLRQTVKLLERIARALEVQDVLLARLAERYAPEPPAAVEAETSTVDWVDEREQAQILAYVERTARETGRAPTDDEVLQYLADEATAAQVARR